VIDQTEHYVTVFSNTNNLKCYCTLYEIFTDMCFTPILIVE